MSTLTRPHRPKSAHARLIVRPGQHDDSVDTGAPSGNISNRDRYIYSQMSKVTTAPSGTHGMIKTATHDSDPGGGLHTGGLNDRPQRSGGYGSMNAQEAAALHQQHGEAFDKLNPQEQAKWGAPATQGTNASNATAGTGNNAPRGPAAHDTDAGGGLHSGGLQTGGLRTGANASGQQQQQQQQQPATPAAASAATPSATNSSATPGDDLPTQEDFADTIKNPFAGKTSLSLGGTTTTSDTTAAAPGVPPGGSAPGDTAAVTRSLQDASQIPDTVGGGGGGYGKIGQVDSPTDLRSQDAEGNITVHTAGGGTVTAPARASQLAPDDTSLASNGTATGIYSGGVEQRKGADGTFAPAQLADSANGAGSQPAGADGGDDGAGDEEEGASAAFSPLKNPFRRKRGMA